MRHVVVVGAGPAGSAAALAARRAGARVTLVDGATFPRDKVCGDGLGPHVFDVLAALDVDTAPLVAGCAPVRSLRLESPTGLVARRSMRRAGWVVPRQEFDDRLRHAALAAGAEPLHHSVRTVRAGRDGVEVDHLHADVVVGADGAESVVRRRLGVPRPRAGTVALAIRGYAHDRAVVGAGEQLLTLTAQHWPAYAWAFPVGDGRVNVGYGELLQGSPPTRAHLLRRLGELLPGVRAERLRAHRLPLSTGRPRQPDGRVLLAGDAAGLVNPVTGEGIFYAVLSGALAGHAAATAPDPGRAHRAALAGRLGAHLRGTDLVAALGRWPWVLDAGLGAAARRQAVFDDLVELGLGRGRLTARVAAGLVVGTPGAWRRHAAAAL